MSLLIRTVRKSEIEALAALNRAAYPDLIEDGSVFDAAQLAGHLEIFPQGQLVAELDGKLVGAIATFILPRAIDGLQPHTWMGVTDGGTFARHDPAGHTLYLADIYVDQSAWGRNVGAALYQALFALCRSLRLDRVVAGGRLYSYADYSDQLSPADYIDRVVAGELNDRVLRSQLRAGFTVLGVLPNYLHDWRSRSFATLLVWNNLERLPAPPPGGGSIQRPNT